MLAWIGRNAARRPRLVLAVWGCAVALLAVQGLGLADGVSSRIVYAEGTASQREHELVLREFGGEDSLIVMLRGPRAAIERQGPRLADRLEAMPKTLVISPWDGGVHIEGLRPSPDVAALVISVEREREGVSDIADSVQVEIDRTVTPPLAVSVGGGPVIVDAMQEAAGEAVAAGERIALPALLIVLLLVFRSVLAAALPVVVGGAVVVAGRGVLDLLLGLMDLDVFALSAIGMLGLALGVDYSLLVVSRFREEIAKGGGVEDAVRATVERTGRSVVPAGGGLVLAMVVSMLVMPSSVVISVAIATTVAAVLSVLSALFVMPAALTLIGTNLERWALPRRADREGAVRRWSLRLSRRPLLVVSAIWLLAVLSAWAFTLDTKLATAALLPSDNDGRIQQEAIQEELGPGWAAPFEIAMEGRGVPVTTPDRLRALAAFQRRVEKDPGVAAMAGFVGLEEGTDRLSGVEEGLIAQDEGLNELGRGLGRAEDGAAQSALGFYRAAAGAGEIGAAVETTQDGSGELVGGLRSASQGSERLGEGIEEAGEGSEDLARGTSDASGGADRLASGLERAGERSEEGESNARVLKNAMESGDRSLAELGGPLQRTEDQLGAAWLALQEMTTGRGDPRYASALAAVEAANEELTGIDPGSGEPVRPPYEGVAAGVEDARGQFDLGLYLAEVLRRNGHRSSEGMADLARASERLDAGLEELANSSGELADGMEELSGAEALSPALRRLALGAEQLHGGLGEVATATGDLAGGLGSGAHQSRGLAGALGEMREGVERGQQGDGIDELLRESPGLFKSGYFYLAGLDGSQPSERSQAAFLVNLDGGGSAARMLVIPRDDPTSSEAMATRDRLEEAVADLAGETDAELVVGGPTVNRADVDAALRDQAPLARLALALVTFLVLVPVVRSLTLPLIAALLNLLTVGATFGLLSLLFDGSLLGGPGYVDTSVLPATVMLIFALAIDYEIFIFARMREEYARTGSPAAAIANGIGGTAHVVTGAALIMIVVFLAFAVSSLATLRAFGVAQAIAVFIDAFVIRFVVIPGLMRALGRWSWWMPAWLDRLLPGEPLPRAEIVPKGAAS